MSNITYTCRWCGQVSQYMPSDLSTVSDCFYKGYLVDEYLDMHYVTCPCCGVEAEIGYNLRTEKGGNYYEL